MISSLQIGKVVYYLLSQNQELVDVIGTKINPLVADETTTYPFIIYRRSSIVPESNKDYIGESTFIEIFVVTDKYKEGVDIAELVRTALEHKNITYNGLVVKDIILEDGSEEFVDNAFIQNLTFKIELE